MGFLDVQRLSYALPDGRMLFDDVAFRVGDGTKLILTGDPTQIDNPYLDASSNGLSYLVERLKGKGLVGHVTLAKSERSELASLVTAEL